MAKDDIGGVWRTIGGKHIFIKDGDDLPTAMKKSGKFKKNKLEKENNSKYTTNERNEEKKEHDHSKGNKEKNAEQHDRKIYTNGEYDIKSYMGQEISIEKFSIKRGYEENVGAPLKIPDGEVNSKNIEQAKKIMKWYDNSYEQSIIARDKYKEELKKFESENIRKLINDKIDFYTENAENSKKDKEWAKERLKKYLK